MRRLGNWDNYLRDQVRIRLDADWAGMQHWDSFAILLIDLVFVFGDWHDLYASVYGCLQIGGFCIDYYCPQQILLLFASALCIRDYFLLLTFDEALTCLLDCIWIDLLAAGDELPLMYVDRLLDCLFIAIP